VPLIWEKLHYGGSCIPLQPDSQQASFVMVKFQHWIRSAMYVSGQTNGRLSGIFGF
jgi:hypothetical protein